MVRVRLVNLTKKFGNIIAVDSLNLDIRDKEFIVFLGPSGCGKTTTLLTIAGIYKPTSGLIYFDDRVVNDVPPKDRNIGMVFQNYALYPHMTAYENIAFPLRLKKLSKDEMEKKIKRVAEMLEISDLLNRKPSQISGGQQQRVALARALVKDPQLFLLDEPLSNLDARLRIRMRAELKRLQKELGITTIYVTHDQIEAMTMADRIAVLNRGKLQQFAAADELYNKPANIFVADFIGTPPINLIDGVIKERDGKLFFSTNYLELKLPESISSLLRQYIGSEVVLGIRPEDVEIGNGELKGVVDIVEPLGRDNIIHIRIGEIRIRALTNFSLRGEIRISLKREKIHLFDKKGGKIIV